MYSYSKETLEKYRVINHSGTDYIISAEEVTDNPATIAAARTIDGEAINSFTSKISKNKKRIAHALNAFDVTIVQWITRDCSL